MEKWNFELVAISHSPNKCETSKKTCSILSLFARIYIFSEKKERTHTNITKWKNSYSFYGPIKVFYLEFDFTSLHQSENCGEKVRENLKKRDSLSDRQLYKNFSSEMASTLWFFLFCMSFHDFDLVIFVEITSQNTYIYIIWWKMLIDVKICGISQ